MDITPPEPQGGQTAFSEPPTLGEVMACDTVLVDEGGPAHNVRLAEDRESGIVMRELAAMDAYDDLCMEDPFGHLLRGYDDDQGAERRDGQEAVRRHAGERGEVANGAAANPAATESAAAEVASGSQGQAEGAEVQAGCDLVTARERRRLVMQQLDEKRKRRRAEMEAVAMTWRGGEAVMGIGEFVDLPKDDDALPFTVHDTHQLVVCGGYTGCVRCGRVVAFQGHARFATPCRGTCPNGSLRPIRRLVRGEHPHDVKRGHLGVQWPSGETAPTPRRYRPTAAV